jgi:hypothetical protein
MKSEKAPERGEKAPELCLTGAKGALCSYSIQARAQGVKSKTKRHLRHLRHRRGQS